MTPTTLLSLIYGGVIIISILTLVSVAQYLRRRTDGRSDIDNEYLFGDGSNGES